MLGIVKIALRRPYTFVVLALLILIFGVLAILWAGLEFPWTPFWAKVVAGGVSDGKEEFWCE